MSAAPLSSITAQSPFQGAERPAPVKWIGGAAFDAMFFVFPTIFSVLYVGAFLVFGGNGMVHSALNAFLLCFAVFHTCGTFFFYFDRQNLAHYRRHYKIYFIGPAVVFLGGMGISITEYFAYMNPAVPRFDFTLAIAFIWVSYHVTRQNIGFAGFYRHKFGLFDHRERDIDNHAIYANALLLYSMGWVFSDYPMFLSPVRELGFWHWLLIPLVAYWVWAMVHMVVARARSLWASKFASWPHAAMVFTSLTFPLPLFFTVFSPEPNFLMFSHAQFGLVAHYTQYIAIVMLVHFHKYPAMMPSAHGGGEAPAGRAELIFGRLPFNGIWALFAFSLLFTGGLVGFFYFSASTGHQSLIAIATGMVIGSGFVHFYLDAYMWAMREDFNRKALLPYLKPL